MDILMTFFLFHFIFTIFSWIFQAKTSHCKYIFNINLELFLELKEQGMTTSLRATTDISNGTVRCQIIIR